MKRTPLISIIITCHNAYRFLDKCFASIISQSFKDYEIVFVDDKSTDKSLAFIKKKYPDTIIVENIENVGFARANNEGAMVAQGEYLFILNADTYLEKDTLLKLSRELKRSKKCHIAQLDIRNYTKSNLKDEPFTFNIDRFGYPIAPAPGKIFYADAAAMIITRELFFKIGGFDESYFIYLEDMDLSWRARMVGENVYLFSGIYVYHYAGGTSISTQLKEGGYTTSFRRRYDAQKNNLRTILKNYSFTTILWTFPISVILASLEGILYLLKGNIKGFWVLHKSIWWNIANWSDTIKARRKIQSIRTIPDRVILEYADKRISKFNSFLIHGIPGMK